MHGPGQVAVQKLEGHQIEHHAEGAGEVIFGLAGMARMMPDWNLRQAGAILLGQHRHEPVHLAIERQSLRQVPTHGPERTSHILDMNAGYLPDEPVAHQTWNLANQNMVLTIGPLT